MLEPMGSHQCLASEVVEDKKGKLVLIILKKLCQTVLAFYPGLVLLFSADDNDLLVSTKHGDLEECSRRCPRIPFQAEAGTR